MTRFVFDPSDVNMRRFRSSISRGEIESRALDVGRKLAVRSLCLQKRNGEFAPALVARQYCQSRHSDQEAKRRTTNQNNPTFHDLPIRPPKITDRRRQRPATAIAASKISRPARLASGALLRACPVATSQSQSSLPTISDCCLKFSRQSAR